MSRLKGDPNYPDDIRQYDKDPRSPFYTEPVLVSECCRAVLGDEADSMGLCPDCGEECTAITKEDGDES